MKFYLIDRLAVFQDNHGESFYLLPSDVEKLRNELEEVCKSLGLDSKEDKDYRVNKCLSEL